MTPFEAAFHYLHLEATVSLAAAISFALSYENTASSEDYCAYLDILDTKLSNLVEG